MTADLQLKQPSETYPWGVWVALQPYILGSSATLHMKLIFMHYNT
ncbi:hypothetical protein CDAR_206231, partial [Caerostris darwini]